MFNIDLIICVFIVELVACCLVIKIFNIKTSFIYILFLQIPNLCVNILCVFVLSEIWLIVLIKMITCFIVSLFITDSFDVKRLIYILLLELVFICAIFGFVEFVTLWLKAVILNITSDCNLINFKSVVAIAVILYIYFIFKLVRYLEKNKIMKQILANVSLFVLGKHISVYGLIDSGNSLRDPITRKPVVLISIASLMKFISGDELKKIKDLYCYNLRCETVTDKDVVIPIFKCSNMKIKTAERTQSMTCMVGLVDNVFENGKYDCLLPRDLL